MRALDCHSHILFLASVGVWKGEQVAIKVIGLNKESGRLQALAEREVRNLEEVADKMPDHVVTIKHWMRKDGNVIIIMERAWGDLGTWLKAKARGRAIGLDSKTWVRMCRFSIASANVLVQSRGLLAGDTAQYTLFKLRKLTYTHQQEH